MIKREHPKIKSGLHLRNKHRERYDFNQLIITCPELAHFVHKNIYDDESIDFFNPNSVKMLNKALLKHFYNVINWNIPDGYLCPPIPGRAEYIHQVADILGNSNNGQIPLGPKIKCLDIGVGANCIYPIIGCSEYGWSFVGADIDPVAIESAGKIIESNPFLTGEISLRLQINYKDIFCGIIHGDEQFDLTVCNPPFHPSKAQAQSGTQRKLKNLNNKNTKKPILNFGGKNSELWCDGGEELFASEMIRQSKQFAKNCFWFSTLISKDSNLKKVNEALQKAEAVEVKTIPMIFGNKTSRIVVWTFLNHKQQKEWKNKKWLL